MRAHKKPDFTHPFDLLDECQLIKDHQNHREIPDATSTNLLVATWNLTNFGLQERDEDHLKIMAEIIRPFDVVAVQEVADDLGHTEILISTLGGNWNAIYTDIAGNQERLGYLFNSSRVTPTGLAAELAMRGYERELIKIQVGDVEEELVFEGFNRNPFMMSFAAGQFEFTLVNVHLYWTVFALRITGGKSAQQMGSVTCR